MSAWLDTIESESVPGLSSIEMIFEPGTDLLGARQVVQERLTQAARAAERLEAAPDAAAARVDEPHHDGPALLDDSVA